LDFLVDFLDIFYDESQFDSSAQRGRQQREQAGRLHGGVGEQMSSLSSLSSSSSSLSPLSLLCLCPL
jgi:hypothetical protein